jgi:hypothetical protein
MRKFLVLFLILPNLLFSQTFKKSMEPYTAKNGKVYRVGDTIGIASPADFSNEFKYYVQGKNLSIKQKAQGVTEYSDTKYDNRYKLYIIKQFKIYEEHGTFAVIDKVFNVMINIEKGLETGEMISPKLEELMYNKPQIFTDSVAYLAYLNRENEISNENGKEFLYLFDNKRYDYAREDEFAYHAEINKTKKFLNETTNQINPNETYFIRFNDEIGNYNFDSLSFPLLWKNNGAQILNDTWQIFTPEDINKNKVELTDLRIFFDNIDAFKSLPLNMEKAQYLVKHRKNKAGDVDRKMYLGIQFKIKRLVGKEYFEQIFIDKGEKYLICEIQRIDFFEDKEFLYNYLNTVE